MVNVRYWIDTVLSTVLERRVLAVTVVAFAVGALLVSDERDPLAVGIGVALLVLILTVAGPTFVGEWHYWAGGGVFAAAGVLVWDSKRQG